jgi:rhodanese-related sulfurtransferase
MKIEQIYTGCLAQGAYYIQSAGEAAIVDPLPPVLDVRKKSEYQAGHLEGSINILLDYLNEYLAQIPKIRQYTCIAAVVSAP